MPKKNQEIEDRLQTIEFLLAGILLKRTPTLKEVSKVIGCSDKTLTALYPDRAKKKGNENPNELKAEDASQTVALDETEKTQQG